MAKDQVAGGYQPGDDFPMPPAENDVERMQSTRTIKVLLTEKEVADKGMLLAEADQKLLEQARLRKATLADFREEKATLTGHRDTLVAEVNSAQEDREVVVYEDYDLTANKVTVIRADTDEQEIVEASREMTAEERQEILKRRQSDIPGTGDDEDEDGEDGEGDAP